MFSQLAGVLLPVFTIVGLGFGWQRLGISFEREFVTRLVLNIAGPCLIIDSLSNLTLPGETVARMAVGTVLMFVATVSVCLVIIRLARLPLRTFLPCVAIGNTGNLGLSVCFFAYGAEGLGLAVAVFVANSIGQFTLTPMLQSGQSPLKTLLTTPVIYGAIIGTTLLAADIQLPQWIGGTVSLLGGLLIPLMLLALGNTLGSLKVSRLPFASFWGLTRIVLGFAIAFAIAELLGLEGIARGVLILQGAMPSAVFSYLFAAKYDHAPDEIAGIVLMSTFFSALTLPLIVAWLLAAGS